MGSKSKEFQMLSIPIIGTKDFIKVPMILGNCFTPRFALNIDRLPDYKDHRRLTVFYNKGLQCVVPGCTRVGTWLIMGEGVFRDRHLDLYTKDFHMMTVDHIHPKSQGGGEELENKQPMCRWHNSRKSDKIVTLEDLALLKKGLKN